MRKLIIKIIKIKEIKVLLTRIIIKYEKINNKNKKKLKYYCLE